MAEYERVEKIVVYSAQSNFLPVFFFSSRRRHTRCLSDWSSDVCSSDLFMDNEGVAYGIGAPIAEWKTGEWHQIAGSWDGSRSEERRVGKECRSRGGP